MVNFFDPNQPFFFLGEAMEAILSNELNGGEKRDGFASGIPTDVTENATHYVVEAELPGCKKEQIKIEYKEGKLVIQAVKEVSADQTNTYLHKGRRYGKSLFSCLLKNVDENSIKASYENGVLILTLPKKEAVSSKEIQID